MRTRTVTCAAIAGTLALAAPASAAQPVQDHGSCADFGANVSTLARTLGADFGATASAVASSRPGAFPAIIVRPEQARFCDPR